jgi:hypothetical protein
MKKFLMTAAAIQVLLLVCFAGYLQYRKWQSFRTYIHKDAATVVRINVYGIITTVLPDYLSRDTKEEQDDGGKGGKSRGSGIELPANLFVYNLRSRNATTLFTSLQINNGEDFEHTLDELLPDHEISRANPACSIATSKDGKLIIAWNKETAALAWSATKEEVITILTAVLGQRDVVRIKESRFKGLTTNSAHMAWLGKGQEGALNFRKGELLAEGKIILPGLILPAQATHPAPGTRRAGGHHCLAER